MEYHYSKNIREDGTLRASFNQLTQKVFYFDFIDWYENGYWTERYCPHVLIEDGKVISNVSVNQMKFDRNGEVKNYIQLGTVMTDPEYRGLGLNQYILTKVIAEYRGQVDGIYLFGNDSVLEYYPKFGFQPVNEYEYYRKISEEEKIQIKKEKKNYQIEKIDLSEEQAKEQLYRTIKEYDLANRGQNPNDGFAMCDNLGLYQFWIEGEYGENIYYLPEEEAYVIASFESEILRVEQIISKRKIDLIRLAISFEEEITEIQLGFTPAEQEGYERRVHKEEDCTLFILGEDLEQVGMDKLMFPVISHA